MLSFGGGVSSVSAAPALGRTAYASLDINLIGHFKKSNCQKKKKVIVGEFRGGTMSMSIQKNIVN